MKNLVLFDFDGTLTKRDTLVPFVIYLSKIQMNFLKLLIAFWGFWLYKLKIIEDKKFKEIVLSIFIKGRTYAEVEKIVIDFWSKKLNSFLRREIFEKLLKHSRNGDKVYIVSANFDFLLHPLKILWPLEGIIATKTERKKGIFTGKIAGDSYKGKNKLRKIVEVFGNLEMIEYYGDEEDDIILKVVGKGIKVG